MEERGGRDNKEARLKERKTQKQKLFEMKMTEPSQHPSHSMGVP